MSEKFSGIYSIADIPFSLTTSYGKIHQMLHDYISDDKPLFSLDISQEIIEREREISLSDGNIGQKIPDAYLETLAVCREFSEMAINHRVLLFHGSAIAVDGYAYLFTAPSGTGKSTHTRLWREMLGDKAIMINDDKPFIKFDGDRISVFGSPWDGKHHLSENISFPLAAICLLSRSEKNRIEKVSCSEIGDTFSFLFRQSYKPLTENGMKISFELIEQLTKDIPIYRLACNISRDAAELSYRAMRKEP